MKKIFLILPLILLSISCNKKVESTSNKSLFSLSLIGEYNLLIDKLDDTYEYNTKVTFKTNIINDADLDIYLNGVIIDQISYSSMYWEYEFYMPNKDSVLNFKINANE